MKVWRGEARLEGRDSERTTRLEKTRLERCN